MLFRSAPSQDSAPPSPPGSSPGAGTTQGRALALAQGTVLGAGPLHDAPDDPLALLVVQTAEGNNSMPAISGQLALRLLQRADAQTCEVTSWG